MDEQTPGQIVELLAKASLAVKSVGKSGKNQKQNYNFRAIDDVVGAVNPALGELGITLTREILSIDRGEAIRTSSGGSMRVTVLHCRFTFTAPDGSSLVSEAIGEGMDSGDKGASKAMSAALKYALCHTLLIPTEDRSDPEWDRAKPDTSEEAQERREFDRAKASLGELLKSRRDADRITVAEGALKLRDVGARIVQEVYEKDALETLPEVERVRELIEAGAFDLSTGDRIPDAREHPPAPGDAYDDETPHPDQEDLYR